MGRINVLPQHIAELIAAGEVVDRPASIIKELVENSLDAGASRITVEVKHGGITYIRVTDNGCGIEKEDMPTAFIRHATSKIKTAEDLDSIASLGFRGEALPSVAAVSRVTLTSRPEGEKAGNKLVIEASQQKEFYEVGCPVGTTIEVCDVFFNTPARMKFLKKDITEANAISALLDRLALANPHVSFEFIRDYKRTLFTPGDKKLLSVVRIVCGSEVAASMIPVDYSSEGVHVTGLISKPNVARSTRSLQSFFINSRFIRSKTCAGAVEESYKNRLMTGRFPACVLNLQLDPSLVDVNVHPAKLEVRFSSERIVYNAVYSACMEALSQSEKSFYSNSQNQSKINAFSLNDFDHSKNQTKLSAIPVEKSYLSQKDPIAKEAPVYQSFSQKMTLKDSTGEGTTFYSSKKYNIDIEVDEIIEKPTPIPPAYIINEAKTQQYNEEPTTAKIELIIEKVEENVVAPKEEPLQQQLHTEPETTPKIEVVEQPVEEVIPYKIIGELFATYILVQQQESFILIDKHAAHERYIYEQIKNFGENSPLQQFLAPVAVSLPREEYFALTENPEALTSMGILAEDFGDGVLMVREVPMLLDFISPNELLGEIAKAVLESKHCLNPQMLDEFLYRVSCRSAIMAGKKSSSQEIAELCKIVLEQKQVYYCPHGRPIKISLSKNDIEKMFGRMG